MNLTRLSRTIKLNFNFKLHNVGNISSSSVALKKEPNPGIELQERNWQLEFHQIDTTGKSKVYDAKPFKMKIVEGKTYKWCACGFSKNQPLCDGTHSIPKMKISLRPLVFKAPVSKEVWFCNCKRSKQAPFCDGTHKKQDVQDQVRK